jgi:two-component system, OmpR family, phosphate regulon response regulator PhoB
VRGIVYPFESFEALSAQMDVGVEERDLELLRPEGLRDGEWVLATVSVGEDSIAVAARAVDRGAGLRLAFLDRDWEQLWSFANGDAPPSGRPSTPSPAFEIQAPPGSTVLVVDDDPDLQNVVCCMLRGAGFGTQAVDSGEAAFDLLRQHPVDLLVLDWSLPTMTGIEFCKRLRRDPNFGHLPVLFLSAHSSERDILEAFSAGADDFVSKPFRAPELRARVLGLLQRSRAPSSARPY